MRAEATIVMTVETVIKTELEEMMITIVTADVVREIVDAVTETVGAVTRIEVGMIAHAVMVTMTTTAKRESDAIGLLDVLIVANLEIVTRQHRNQMLVDKNLADR